MSLTASVLTDVRDAHNVPFLVKGRTSKILVEVKDEDSAPAPSFSGDETLKEVKDQLNTQQKKKDNSERDLVHGVVPSEAPIQNLMGCKNGKMMENIFPCDPESVFHAIKHCDVETESEPQIENQDTELVYHLRASLLEQLETFLSLAVGNLPGTEDELNCSVFLGQTYQPCGIGSSCLPVRHEMLSVHKISSDGDSQLSEDTINSINSCLVGRWKAQSQSVSKSVQVKVEDVDLSNLNTLDVCRHSDDTDMKSERDNFSLTVGLTCRTRLGTDTFDICLVNLDSLACLMCALPHPALLWSDHDKFTGQFNRVGFPQEFKPFSLFPMKFVHDLSFWLKEGDDSLDERELFDVIRCVAGDVVVRVDMVDAYRDASTGRHSRCYRLHFCSHDQVMPYSTSWKLQSCIRMEVARRCHVTLR